MSDEIEALEYRIKSLKSTLMLVTALFLGSIGLVVVATASLVEPVAASLLYLGVATPMLFGMVALRVAVQAERKSGYCRSALSRVFGEYDDPPLEEWRDSLKDSDAFPVDGDDT